MGLQKSNSTTSQQTNGLSSVEVQINQSNVGKFIQDASQDEIAAALLYCFSVSGLLVPNYPNEVSKSVLIDFILSNYGSFRIEEVRTAFQMNASGRLGEINEHFQNFSPVFFGKVMAAFRKKSEDLKKYQESARSWNQPVTPLHRSDEIPDEEMVRLSFQNYRKVGKWQLIYPGCYKTLKKYGHEIDFETGGELRRKFNMLSEAQKKGSIQEDTETKFKKFLTAYLFDQFINEGKTDIQL